MQKIDKILFLSDLTTYSLPSLDYALTISKLYNAKLYILHVLDNSPFENISRESHEMEELFLSEEENARIEMNRYIREKLSYYQNIIQVIKCGNIKEETKKFAEKEKINFIIFEINGEVGVFDLGRIIEKNSIQKNNFAANINRSKQAFENRPIIDTGHQYNNFNKTFFN